MATLWKSSNTQCHQHHRTVQQVTGHGNGRSPGPASSAVLCGSPSKRTNPPLFSPVGQPYNVWSEVTKRCSLIKRILTPPNKSSSHWLFARFLSHYQSQGTPSFCKWIQTFNFQGGNSSAGLGEPNLNSTPLISSGAKSPRGLKPLGAALAVKQWVQLPAVRLVTNKPPNQELRHPTPFFLLHKNNAPL